MTCWSCHGATAQRAPFCGSCRKLQPLGASEDSYSIFALPREFDLDQRLLEQRFRDLSRTFHPDRFARSEPRERRIALERATRLNDAYRALRDWRSRAASLLRLAGQEVFGEGGTFHDPDFLAEHLEMREALALARADGDATALGDIAARSRSSLAALEAECGRLFGEQDWSTGSAAEIARRLSRARYHDNLIADAEAGVGAP